MNSTRAGYPLRTRVLLPVAIAGTFALCFGAWRVRDWALERFIAAEARRAETLTNAACAVLEGCGDEVELQRRVQLLAAERGVLELFVTTDGRVAASSRGEWLHEAPAAVPDHAGDALSVARPLDLGVGGGHLSLTLDDEPARSAANELALRIVIFGAGALIALFGLALTLLRYAFLRPLGLLEGGLDRLRVQDRSRAA